MPTLWGVLDQDEFLRIAVEDILVAANGWLSGAPLDEVALLNRITAELGRRRRGCDLGLETPVRTTCHVFLLHRQGANQVDLFGSDLAVTVDFNDGQFIKTAFFQLKRSSELHVQLERQQLDDATRVSAVGDRSFVFAVDDERLCFCEFQ